MSFNSQWLEKVLKGKYLSWSGFSYTDYMAASFTEYSGNDELILLSFFQDSAVNLSSLGAYTNAYLGIDEPCQRLPNIG